MLLFFFLFFFIFRSSILSHLLYEVSSLTKLYQLSFLSLIVLSSSYILSCLTISPSHINTVYCWAKEREITLIAINCVRSNSRRYAETCWSSQRCSVKWCTVMVKMHMNKLHVQHIELGKRFSEGNLCKISSLCCNSDSKIVLVMELVF